MENMTDIRNKRSGGRTIIPITLAMLTAAALGTAYHFHDAYTGQQAAMDQGRLSHERLLGEKLQLEKQVIEVDGRLSVERTERTEAEQRVQDLERRVKEALDRQRGLEARARQADRAAKRAKELESANGALNGELSSARASVQELRAELDRMRSERDALAAQVEARSQSAWMVNNAVVEALRGRKGRLTVKARRTNEIRMAFDLPKEMAQHANFRVITPDGSAFAGSDPALSMDIDTTPDDAALAAVDLTAGMLPGEPTARVHLKFDPDRRLQPGTYRIDVRSGDTYLNTVLLNLR
jgi:hypothetical protein